MVRIRLRRVGSRNQASFRIVAAEKEAPRDGRFLEILGHYNPRTEPSTVVVDEARLFHWLQNGAQPSDAIVDALRALGTWERWDRFKAGEELEVLLKEAEESRPDVDPRTRRDDLIGKRKKKSKARRKEEEAEAEAEPEAEPEAEAESEPEAKSEAEEAPEPEAEPAAEAEAEEPEAEEEAETEAETEAEEPAADEEPAEEAEAEQEEQPESDEEADDEDAKTESEADEEESEAEDKE
jgi:small subunit ribosomal protein S16